MSAKHNYIFFLVFRVKIGAFIPQRNRESPCACVALCSIRRHFINHKPIRAKLYEKLPHCLRNKKP